MEALPEGEGGGCGAVGQGKERNVVGGRGGVAGAIRADGQVNEGSRNAERAFDLGAQLGGDGLVFVETQGLGQGLSRVFADEALHPRAAFGRKGRAPGEQGAALGGGETRGFGFTVFDDPVAEGCGRRFRGCERGGSDRRLRRGGRGRW